MPTSALPPLSTIIALIVAGVLLIVLFMIVFNKLSQPSVTGLGGAISGIGYGLNQAGSGVGEGLGAAGRAGGSILTTTASGFSRISPYLF